MNILENLKKTGKVAFSYEILPPIKGNGLSSLLKTVESLQQFNPSYINITTHRSEYIFVPKLDGTYSREKVQRRPGTIAVAASIQQHFHVPTIPHILCSGFTKRDIEYLLINLQFLEIDNILALRGDKIPGEKRFKAEQGGLSHTTELIELINDFNNSKFVDGKVMLQKINNKFHYGVACYPEKHDEAPNLEQDLYWLKKKIDLGAQYAVSQLFYDNKKFFSFVNKVREAGINVPIIPGIKPITKKNQIYNLPKIFGIDIPQKLFKAIEDSRDDAEARKIGIQWTIAQCQELIEKGVPSIHFYTMGRALDVVEIAKELF